MSDNWGDEQWAAAVEAGGRTVLAGQIRRAAKAEQRIAELERREALLTALVHAEDAMWKHDAECDGEDAEACQPFGQALVDARTAIDWIPRP